MGKSYYTVIVGTQPGVYRDWTQAAPKVSEISGAIHQRFKTHAEAWDAFRMAEREGAVRAVQAELDVEAASTPLSRMSLLRDDYERPSPLEPRRPQDALAERLVAQHTSPVTRLGRQDDQNERAATLPSPSRADRVTVPHGNTRVASTSRGAIQTFRGYPGYPDTAVLHPTPLMNIISRSPRNEDNPGITSLAGHDGSNIGLEVYARRDILNPTVSPGIQNWGDNSEERRASVQSLDQEDMSSYTFDLPLQEVGGSLTVPILPRPPSACSHISVCSSAETASSLSFDADLSVQVGSSGFELHRRSEAADAPRSVPSPAPSELCFVIADSLEGIGPGPSAQSQEDDSERNAPLTILRPRAPENSRLFGTRRVSPLGHMRSPLADISHPRGDSPPPSRNRPSPSMVASTSRTPTHLRTRDIRLGLVGIAASSPRRAASPWSPSLPSQTSRSVATGLELSLRGDAVSSPRHHPLPQLPLAQASPRGNPAHYRRAREIGAQSPAGDQTHPRNATPQNQAAPLRLNPATRDRTQGMQGFAGMELMDGVAPSPSRIPLPLSPATSASLLAQPRHRHRPDMPLYPSLADGDHGGAYGAPLSPSGLDIAFGLPTPALSPTQVPVVIRSPSMDPRSPVSPRTRIPGVNIMGLLRVVSHF